MTTIIHTNFHSRRSGISVHVEDIVPALRDLGLQAHAVGAALNKTVPQIDINEIQQLLGSNTPMVWHAHRPHSLRKGLQLRKRYPHLRVAWTHHSWRSPGWTTQRAIQKADGLVCLTQQGVEQLSSPSTLIPHGIAQAVPTPKQGPPFFIGVMGRIRPDKGHEDIARAFLSLAKDYPDWTLVFCGEVRPQHKRFGRKLLNQGSGRILHWEYDPDKATIYSKLSIVVMPSHAEGFSLVVPESLSFGRALLASRLPHFSNLFKEEVHALCFEPGNSMDLESQLRRLMKDKVLREQFETNGLEHVRANMSIVTEAESLAALYQRLLSRPTT
jgi:mannosyltransferase